jgi:hypothetical protein
MVLFEIIDALSAAIAATLSLKIWLVVRCDRGLLGSVICCNEMILLA